MNPDQERARLRTVYEAAVAPHRARHKKALEAIVATYEAATADAQARFDKDTRVAREILQQARDEAWSAYLAAERSDSDAYEAGLLQVSKVEHESGPRAARFPTDAAFEAWLVTIFEEGALRWLTDQHMPREHLIWMPDDRHLITHPGRRDAYYDRSINQVDGSSS